MRDVYERSNIICVYELIYIVMRLIFGLIGVMYKCFSYLFVLYVELEAA